jgi:multiple sugar transport system ATP-binding protein
MVTDGQQVVFGLRPDDLTPVGYGIAESGENAKLTLDVALSEPLGTETILYTQIAGQEAQGKMFGPRNVAPGEVLEFEVALEKVRLFDSVTGMSMRKH